MTVSVLIETLSNLPYFAVLDPHTLHWVAQRALSYSFDTDEVIFIEGDEAQGLWIIEDGNVKISKLSADGNEYILHLLGAGSTFNEIAALDGGVTPANAIAMSLVSAWTLTPETLTEIIETQPKVARAMIRMLTGKVRTLNKQIEDLTLYPVMTRLARFLLEQAENPVLSGPGITRAAIAAHLATTPETISRVLAKLQQSGAIRFDRHRIMITNAALLRSIAEL
jgi:CRP/FNR family transcriptional regulator